MLPYWSLKLDTVIETLLATIGVELVANVSETGSRGENEITVVFNCRPEYEALNVNPEVEEYTR